MVRDGDGLRRKAVRVAVADGFLVGFAIQMVAKDTSGKAKLALGKRRPWPGRNTERRGPWQVWWVLMVYPFAERVVESGGAALAGKGRVLRGVRTALWKRSRPPQAWQIGCGQGGSSISGTVTVKPWASRPGP